MRTPETGGTEAEASALNFRSGGIKALGAGIIDLLQSFGKRAHHACAAA